MIIVLGAGISGLSVAAALKKAGKAVMVLEASDRPGGSIHTVRKGPYLLEAGPNTLQLNDELFAWLNDQELADELVTPAPGSTKRYVLRNEKYMALPAGPISLLSSSLLTFRSKFRILKERNLPAGKDANESVDSFFRRRLGDEITDYIVWPFVSGIYAGDPREMIMSVAFPRFFELEQKHGSLIRGLMKERKPQTHKGLASFKKGLECIPEKLASDLGDFLRLGTPATGLRRLKSGDWQVKAAGEKLKAQVVISTLPAPILAELLAEQYPEQADQMGEIAYPPMTVVHTSYKRNMVTHPLDGFGALHNQLEPSYTLGTLFSSTLFPGRCPDDEVLLTSFVGGALHPKRALQEDGPLLRGVIGDHQKFLRVRGHPNFHHIYRWESAIPQYGPAITHIQRMIPELAKQGLHVMGNWVGGVSVPNCILNGQKLAEALIAGASTGT